jgi:fucose 4-O-acetylase-like acetyltransferase
MLVTFHATTTDASTVIDAGSTVGIVFFAHLFNYFRMPLFAFIAGFVYAFRPVTSASWGRFLTRKLARLWIPYAIAATAMFVLDAIGRRHDGQPQQLAELWRVFVYPTYHFWFIQALLVDFAVIVALETAGAMNTIGRFGLVFAASIAGFIYLPDPAYSLLSIPQAEYLMPFFLLGLGANRFRAALLTRPVFAASLIMLITGLVIHAYLLAFDPGYSLDRRTLLGLAIGLPAGVCALRWSPPILALRRLGDNSFAIYLYHYAFIIVAAHWCKAANFRSAIPLLVLLVTAGTVGPVLLQRLLQRNQVLRSVVFGMR